MLEIKILGPGCKKCDALEKTVREAVETINLDAEIIKVTDPGEIVEEGVMMTPGLIINGKVKTTGKVPKKDKIIKMIQEELT